MEETGKDGGGVVLGRISVSKMLNKCKTVFILTASLLYMNPGLLQYRITKLDLI